MSAEYKKKLIEVSLPLEAINKASAREKSIRHGHPSTLHLWWARRPLATCRAVLFGQLVDDPSAHPELFPTVAEQDVERQRLHTIMERLVLWENSNNQQVLAEARAEIRKCFTDGDLPVICDPFAGGGSIPLEAQRLGLQADSSDLNPVAVLINRAMLEIPPKFRDMRPVHPEADSDQNGGSRGLAEDIRRYGKTLRDEAFAKIGHLYPTVTDDDGAERTVIAWIWARTVKSPNPANPIEVPLVKSWWLSKKKRHEAWVEPLLVDGEVRYQVHHDANGPTGDEDGTVSRTGAVSFYDGTPISLEYIREESRQGRLGSHLIAVVCEDAIGRVYLSPNLEHIKVASIDKPDNTPSELLPEEALGFRVQNYGFRQWSDLFTNRQLVALTTLCELVTTVREKVYEDALAAGMPAGERLEAGGTGAQAYADAVAVYLGLAISKLTDYSSSLCSWHTTGEKMSHVFVRQAIPMVWDYAEANPFSSSSGNFLGQVEWVTKVVENLLSGTLATVSQQDATTKYYSDAVISTDPPYYDNIGYSDLSDFFYVWQRQALAEILPTTYRTLLTPKADELVANPYRHDGKEGAQGFFIDGFNNVFHRIRQQANQALPMTVYYAYKQQDADAEGTSSTGWYTLLDGLIKTGWEITATWPVRSELSNRPRSQGSNALASSIVLACRPRSEQAEATTRRSFIAALRQELPQALRAMMQGSVAPVDLAQAAIGPGISVFSRYSRVREADGSDMSVRDALLLINQTLDEVINEQESDFDPATRFAVKWYKSYGWGKEDSGLADQLSRSTDTSIASLERGGILETRGGMARLIAPEELAGEWDPISDDNVSIWEAVVRLAAIMMNAGSERVTGLIPMVATRVSLDAVKELGFLLFHEAEKKGVSADALLFNSLVSAWGDLADRSQSLINAAARQPEQSQMDI